MWSIRIVGPAATAVILPLAFYVGGLIPVLGYLAGFVVVGVIVAELALSVLFFNQLTAAGIQVLPAGVKVLTRSGREFLVPWAVLTFADTSPRGFRVIRYASPRPGARVLSPNQYSAVKATAPSPGSEGLALRP